MPRSSSVMKGHEAVKGECTMNGKAAGRVQPRATVSKQKLRRHGGWCLVQS